MPFARGQAAQLLLGRRARTFARSDRDPMWVSGGALMIARSDLSRLGGWAEDYFLYFEDADLCLRHLRLGGRIGLSQDLLAEHPKDADRSQVEGVSFRSGRRFVARHQGRRYVGLLWLLLIGGYLPRRLARLTLGRLHGSRRSAPPVATFALDILKPSRIERRLGVQLGPQASDGRYGTES